MSPERTQLTAADITFETRGLTPEEVGAVSAVLISAASEQRHVASGDAGAPASTWMRNRRPMRTPLEHGPGAWRSF